MTTSVAIPDPALATDVEAAAAAQAAVTAHNNDTTGVHGIADTAGLATTSAAAAAAQALIDLHSADTTGVHGITDMADLALKSYVDNAVAGVGSGSSFTESASVFTAGFTATASKIHRIDVTSGNITALLPNAPADKTMVLLKMVQNGNTTNYVTYQCQGADVINRTSGPTTGTLTKMGQAVWLQYKATGAIWTVITTDTPARHVVTVVIAASDSTAAAKASADYVCTGTSDQVTINAALASIAAFKGGKAICRIGTYNNDDCVVIDQDYIILEGEGHPMWKEYHSGQSTEGTGCAKFKTTVTGKNGIEIRGGTVQAGDPRHRGITVRGLYLYGFGYTGIGIYNGTGAANSTRGGAIDWSFFERNHIHNFAGGIQMYADSPWICHNSIQDVGTSPCINYPGPTYGVISNNLMYDNQGTAITCSASGVTIEANHMGRCAGNGIIAGNFGVIVKGNHIHETTLEPIKVTGDKCSVIGNTIQQNLTTKTHGILVSSNDNSIVGNTLANTSLSTGEAISFRGGTRNTASGNTIVPGAFRYAFYRGVGNTIRNNAGYKDHAHGSVMIADGGTIAHGLAGGMITNVQLTPSVPAFVAATTFDAANMTVALKDTAGAAITAPKLVHFSADLGDDVGPCIVTTAVLSDHYAADLMPALADASALVLVPDWVSQGDAVPVGAPTFYNNVLNGKPAFRFNGTNQGLYASGGITSVQPNTIFVVMKRAAVTGSLVSMVNSGNANTNAFYINSGGFLGGYAGTNGATTLSPGTTAHVVEMVSNGASTIVGMDGTLQTINIGTVGMGGGIRIATNNTGTGEWFNGDIYEVLVYAGAMSAPERALVRAALGAKYGITVS